MAISLRGVIEDVIYRNDNNDYTVLEIDADGELVTATGTMPRGAVGECVTLFGDYTYHREFGKQFAFTSYEKSLPSEEEGIIQYLSGGSLKGIGPVTAVKIVNKFGKDTFDVIENHPEWLSDIPGITRKKAKDISESFRGQADFRQVMVFFQDYMGTGEITKIYKRLGASAVGIVKDNPYVLCEGNYGITFAKADEMAKSFGFAKDNLSRVQNGLLYLLKYNADMHGHTCMPRDSIIDAAAELLQISCERVAEVIDILLKSRELALFYDGEREYLMTSEVEEAEEYITDALNNLMAGVISISRRDIAAIIEETEIRLGLSYATLQREAIFRAVSSGVSIITGGPGTGKTTVVRALITIFRSLGLKVALCAPTGRAAKRLSEATAEPAKTIHRMLEMERGEHDEIRFMRNARCPLDERVIIVDEASMVDLSLMNALMHAIARGSRLILIGDSDQLPSVGAGNVLSDVIAGVPDLVTSLTEIFRQSRESLIVTNAHRINSGAAPTLNVTDNDFFFVRREREEDIPGAVADLILDRLPRAYGEDIRADIQVITPSKKGAGGVEMLNRELQARINPPLKFKKERAAHGTVFREGDRVMQTVNNYELEWSRGGLTGLGIFNGDIGIIESIDFNAEVMEITFDERTVSYPFDNLDELELAYAITVHKSQGSEYPVVIIPMYRCAPMLLTRNLLYTAVTRAKRMVILVGKSDIPARMVANNREVHRFTTLRARICTK